MNKQAVYSYLRALGATTLASLLALHKSPLDFTGHDLKLVANAVWVSFIPVVIRAISKSDTAFGFGSNAQNPDGVNVTSNYKEAIHMKG